MTADTLITLVLIILFLPLFSFALLLTFGKRLPRKGDTIATGLMFLNLALAFVVLFSVLGLEALDPPYSIQPRRPGQRITYRADYFT